MMGKPTNVRREALIELLADVSDGRTKLEKCAAAGYKNSREIYRLQRQPEFRQAVLDRMRAHVGTNLPLVYRRLFLIAETGTDRDAIKACDALLKAAGEIASVTTAQVVNVTQSNAEREDNAEARIKQLWDSRVLVTHDAQAEQPAAECPPEKAQVLDHHRGKFDGDD